MRPIKLMGHERSLTQVKYNREGDLIFSVSKDSSASIWYSSNGERLGTLEGHKGTIWSIDVDSESILCSTGSADLSIRLWKVATGECVFQYEMSTPVRRVAFSPDNSKLLAVTDQVMGHQGTITVFNISYEGDYTNQSAEPELVIKTREGATKVVVAGWSHGGEYIIAGHEDGYVSKYDGHTGEFIQTVQAHGKYNEEKVLSITDIQFAPEDKSYFITSSKDKCSTLIDVETLEILKVYIADAPMNTAAITPKKNFVILGGGQEARNVTTTAESQGKFEARFYHKIFVDEIGRVKGHFGPLNSIAVHPNGSGYASGGEDGFIRVHSFDKSYFDFEYDAERTERAIASGAT
ncbi:translation initiation factor eIF3 subunit [Yamadazyma tenuis]|uniref:Eukaryotic translation initiation factor 3 subunit I n=1 Tax=Candida tenuis (strain ATCC 10573 / BCRC 21748 / CBS 615 / JCM 9827 / NBRC 10315 / NRRL Y-1498 / VKM Y-70) TaxID=590646 RepID=G3B7F2_CANTC|nr:WD40 repeat-like protein [Yamadazyma tenuis ATCC 10573]EGV62260.1 WD40 repeat-like protein [Yamadazyma tenuis ATCC 10573]WEJ93518.1 translation initiation factor eIF3 subunit [Yamadazyma tenuis]